MTLVLTTPVATTTFFSFRVASNRLREAVYACVRIDEEEGGGGGGAWKKQVSHFNLRSTIERRSYPTRANLIAFSPPKSCAGCVASSILRLSHHETLHRSALAMPSASPLFVKRR